MLTQDLDRERDKRRIRRRIARLRRRIERHGRSVRTGGGRLLSWRTYAQRFPGWFLVGALAAGFGVSSGIRAGLAGMIGLPMLRRFGRKCVDLTWDELGRVWNEAARPAETHSDDGDRDGR